MLLVSIIFEWAKFIHNLEKNKKFQHICSVISPFFIWNAYFVSLLHVGFKNYIHVIKLMRIFYLSILSIGI